MRVAVGSGNPVKCDATERALDDADVSSVPVPSGVSEQPTGIAETRTGAENRAVAALESGDYDFGVGIEGGVASFEGSADLFLVMWAAVTDGEATGFGAGPSLRLPGRIADRIREGEELGPVMDDVLGTENVAKKQGAAGAFTGGRMSRTDALESAVTAAFAPFSSGLY
ncbi:inosine/xanthosine triphosphatase [Halopelagius inordinatus]|uniref:Probable inosine/xanthosine triphosphatase n=1 Tax=Halopelagius inordinatus TaxID=553467 RepID=A0A1I2MXU5_9EURY|nr:inosine/xanthosine triphosphatase [Halopelagius inordinatus]SFF93951.1 inosine/xanthosine triphosphatase [Halopelagius inordinatus]